MLKRQRQANVLSKIVDFIKNSFPEFHAFYHFFWYVNTPVKKMWRWEDSKQRRALSWSTAQNSAVSIGVSRRYLLFRLSSVSQFFIFCPSYSFSEEFVPFENVCSSVFFDAVYNCIKTYFWLELRGLFYSWLMLDWTFDLICSLPLVKELLYENCGFRRIHGESGRP